MGDFRRKGDHVRQSVEVKPISPCELTGRAPKARDGTIDG